MELHEREFFISRICAGYLKYRVNPELTLVIKFPDADIRYSAQEIYLEAYESAKEDGLFSDKDLYNFLLEYKMWDKKLEDYLTDTTTGLLHQIEALKVQLFQVAFDTTKQERIRKCLLIAKKEYSRLNQIRHEYDYITCHGVALYSRWSYIIKNCTYCDDRIHHYDWDDTSIQKAMTYFQSNMIPDETYRFLSHNEPWSTEWAGAKINGNVFNSIGSNLTDEQHRLLIWTNLYDNVGESPDCPPKFVLDDDDMLDGWLILERKEREDDQVKKRTEDALSKNKKIAGADEVFIMASNKEDAQNINQLNDARSTMIKNMRLKQVAQKGSMPNEEFADVKREQSMKANRAYIDKMKGK